MIMPNLSVKDLQASLDFYVNKLGFKHNFTMAGPDGADGFAIVWLHDGVHLGLGVDPETAGKGQGVNLMLYVAQGESVDDLYAHVKARGVKIDQDIKTEFWGDRTFAVTDPDGYTITLCETVKQLTEDEMAAYNTKPG